jgi:hypothetical protein
LELEGYNVNWMEHLYPTKYVVVLQGYLHDLKTNLLEQQEGHIFGAHGVGKEGELLIDDSCIKNEKIFVKHRGGGLSWISNHRFIT